MLVLPVLVAASLAILAPSRAADPQPYTLAIAPTGNRALDRALAGSSRLAALRQKAPAAPFALITRAKEDVGRLETVLQSFGYYQGTVNIAIAGHALGDPALLAALDKIPQGTPVEVTVAVRHGPLFHLGAITIEGAVPAGIRSKLGLKPGQPAVAADVLAAGARLLGALQEDGYALAKVEPPIATEDAQHRLINVTFKVEAGRRAVIGPIRFTGLKAVNERFVRRRLALKSGQLYQPSKIEEARRDLAALGVFSGVTVEAADRIGPNGRIPITFAFQERPKYAVGVTAAYSTDLGGSLEANWSDRNVFGNAEQLNLSAAGTGLGGTAITGLGYDVTGQFVKPDFLRRDQSLQFDARALKQNLQAYEQQAVTADALIHRKFSLRWDASFGLSAEQERIAQEGVTRNYTLLGLPVTVRYDSTGLLNLLQDPTHGSRAALLATPMHSLGSGHASFAILQMSGSHYFDLSRLGIASPGRSILAMRGLVGSVAGASRFELPPDQRFYAGGSATVRGFRYQSIGPRFADGTPTGGTAVDAGTVALRQRLFGNFGMAAFIDAGQVSAGNTPFTGTLRVGAGVGIRYYTPIGPIRLDVAVPVNRPHGGDSFEIYIGLGQAF
ncbi:MAG TPA: autotransporter assembly complex family protein [Stellaceae bacterium]|nr:autotransporter assembly complex family protein [Stellaceae bacterium]